MKPILFEAGPITIYSYGAFLSLGIIAGLFWFWRGAKKLGFPEEDVLDLAILSLISGFVGGRLVFAVFHWGLFWPQWQNLFYSLPSGLLWYGAFIFGFPATFLYVRRRGWSPKKILDLAAPSLALAQAVGMMGCVLAGCAYPTSQWEASLSLGLFLLIEFVRRREVPVGFLFSLYLMGAGGIRFGAEIFRVEQVRLAGVNVNQVLAGLEMISGASLFLVLLRSFSVKEKVKEVIPKAKKLLRVDRILYSEARRIKALTQRISGRDMFFEPFRTIFNAEVIDEAQELISHDRAEALRETLRFFEVKTRKALSRLRGGEYGVCEKCGKKISEKRLRVFPQATLCIECAREEEGK